MYVDQINEPYIYYISVYIYITNNYFFKCILYSIQVSIMI